MKVMLEVCMYSGMCHIDPRCEVTTEQERTLVEKVKKLHKTAVPNRFGTGVLGQDNFCVVWGVIEISQDNMKLVDNYMELSKQFDIVMVRALPGRITVDKNVDGKYQSEMFEDTEDIHSLLANLAAPAIADHHEWCRKEMEAYQKSILGE
jgi:hypothetical protein